MLKSREKNRKKYYRVNPHFLLLPELISIVRKTDESNDVLLKNISKLGDIELLLLTGDFIGKAKDIDVFVVGNIAEKDLQEFLNAEFPEKSLKFGVMNKDDFLYRITLKDKFVKDIFTEKNSIIVKNKIKKETEPLMGF